MSLLIEIYFILILIIFGILFFSNLFRLDKYLINPLFNASREKSLSLLNYPLILMVVISIIDVGCITTLSSQLVKPIKFEKEKNIRYTAIKNKLLDIRD